MGHSPVRVLYVMGHGGGGGIERHVYSLITCLNRSLIEPSLCVLFEPGEESGALQAAGVPVYVLHARNGHDLAGAVRFFKVLRSARPQVAHLHELHFLPALVLRLFSKVRALCSEHCEIRGAGTKTRLLWRLAAAKWSRVLAISTHTACCLQDHLGVPADAITVVHNAIEMPRLGNPSRRAIELLPETWRGSTIVGGVGRLAHQKDWPLFLSVAAVLLRRNPTSRFIIVGDGPLRRELQESATSAGLNHAVLFTGWADARKYFPLFDAFLLTSHHEQLPTVLLEAFALRVPVAGCIPAGGTREVLAFARRPAGEFIEGRDPDALAGAVLRLLNGREHAAACADEGYRIVEEHFNMRRTAARITEIYAGLLSSR